MPYALRIQSSGIVDVGVRGVLGTARIEQCFPCVKRERDFDILIPALFLKSNQ